MIPPPIVPAPMTATRSSGLGRSVCRHVAQLRGRALGEERVNQGFGLLALDALDEELPLAPTAFLEGQRGRGFDRLDRFHGRDLTAADLACEIARGREERGVGVRRPEAILSVARFHSRSPGSHLLRERHRVVRQISVDQRIEESGCQRFRRLDRLARHAELQRLLDTDQPWQSLRAFGARDDAEIHFRLTEQRLRNCHAIVPGHRQLQPAAEALP